MDDFVGTLLAAKNADRTAMESLMIRFGPLIRAECFEFVVRGGSEISHSDLSQEVMVQVWSRLAQFRGVAENDVCLVIFQKWLRITARNTVTKILAKRRATTRAPNGGMAPFCPNGREWDLTVSAGETPSRLLAEHEQVEKIHEAIGALDDEQRRLIRLCFFERCTLKQAAERMALSYDQVRLRFNRALDDLRMLLKVD